MLPNHPMFWQKPFSNAEAYLRLMQGDHMTIRERAHEWGWSKSRTQRFITAVKKVPVGQEMGQDVGQNLGQEKPIKSIGCDAPVGQEMGQDVGQEMGQAEFALDDSRVRARTRAVVKNPIPNTKNLYTKNKGVPFLEGGTGETFLDPLSRAVEMWNDLAEELGLPKVQKFTATRKAKLKRRLADCGGLDGWATALDKVRQSDFLSGAKKDWKASFDFLMQESSFTRVMEGTYETHDSASNTLARKFANIRAKHGMEEDHELDQAYPY